MMTAQPTIRNVGQLRDMVDTGELEWPACHAESCKGCADHELLMRSQLGAPYLMLMADNKWKTVRDVVLGSHGVIDVVQTCE